MMRSVCSVGLMFLVVLSSSLLPAAEPSKQSSGTTSRGIEPSDWPWWRGPTRNGIASGDQSPPIEFGESKNVLWKTPIVGRGHGSAIVVGAKVFLATADNDKEVQSLLCLDRATGKEVWNVQVHKGHFIKGGNEKSTHASSTPACDGERVFVNFINDNGVWTTAFDLNGKQLWQTKTSKYVIHQGYGASPVVYGPLVIVMADNKGGGAIAGLDRAKGNIIWKQERPKLPNYASPSILTIDGHDQMLMTGCDLVTSFDPLSGKKNWEIPGSTTECVTTAVTDGKLIFTSGGYPKNHISAVHADGSGKVEWEDKTRVYVPSMLVRDGRLYFVTDAGVAMCRESSTGKELFSLRLGGTFSSSPVIVGDNLYAFNEAGEGFVLKITPTAFEKIAENKVGDEVFSEPAICGSQIFLRVASHADGKRHETLYCFGTK
jgi:outer membrane protein assembly factor BamB